MAGGNSLGERVARLEEFVGTPVNPDEICLANQIQVLRTELAEFKEMVAGVSATNENKFADLFATVAASSDGLKDQVKKLGDELTIMKGAVASNMFSSAREGHSKVKIPEPKSYGGARVAKDLENFLWDMEQYFKAAHIDEREQVSITSMYLVGDAKLWWRTRTDGDASVDRPVITTFEALKKELKEQFLPLNASWLARESLRNLKQTGSVRDYVKEFSSLLLDIKNMSDEDKLFNFLAGLKPWAQAELRRQAVKDLPSAVAAADSLVDYKQAGSGDAERGKNSGKNHKDEGRFKKKDKGNGAGDAKDGKYAPREGDKGCFICDGPHYARNCPRKEKVNALRVEEQNEENDGESEGPMVRANILRLVVLRTEKSVEGDGLMYVKALVNGVAVMALVDTGATNSFISTDCANELGLSLAPSTNQIKTANSELQRIRGCSSVDLEIGDWKGKFNFHVVALDDFDCILGIDFMVKTNTAVMMHLGGVMIWDTGCPCFVKAVPNKVDKGKQKISKCGAVQVLVGDIICGIEPRVGESLELDSVLDGFLVGPESMSPRVGDTAGT